MKFRQIAVMVLAFICVYAVAQTVLLSGVTATGAGSSTSTRFPGSKQFQGWAQTTAGTGTAVITVECSLDNTHWDSTPIGTITLALTSTATFAASVTTTDRCLYLRGNPTTMAGTGTAATLLMNQ